MLGELFFPDLTLVPGRDPPNYLFLIETALHTLSTNWLDIHNAYTREQNGEESVSAVESKYEVGFLADYLHISLPKIPESDAREV